MNPKERFINACLNKEVDRPPVWMMRQAGRYLPEYRLIKDKHDTKTMMQTPQIACEITLQPVAAVGVDAAILYSDILMIPDAMGMGLSFAAGEGPRFEFGIQHVDDLNRLNAQGLTQKLSYVYQTIRLCLEKLPEDYPLIGFAGAPFTVACYMISGGKDLAFDEIKLLAWTQPAVYRELLKLIATATAQHLLQQAEAGVCAVQLFDTWAGVLSADDYRELALPYTQQVFAELQKAYVPAIHYIKGGDHLLAEMTRIQSDVIGMDWRTDLKTVCARTGHRYAIQGNFDPDLLLATPEMITARLKDMVSRIENPRKGYIINLGHGIGQKTPVRNAKHFVEEAKRVFA